MVFLITYARGALTTPQHDSTYSLMVSIIPAILVLSTLGSTSGSLYSSLSLFCPASRCTLSSLIPITYKLKVDLQIWWNRKAASFTFSWAITKTCCSLSGILLAILPPGFLITLQMSWTVLSMRTLSLSGLYSPWSLTSNLAASG